jgi:3-oxoacyl-(acyl-carrier-protein) synthase/NAD(P)-dependent dehydrogenase (short-subunit alcohol dehydrogenase family)/SAM-dependent methyltransferase
MTEIEGMTPLQRSVVAIRELRSRLDRAEQARTEPIAIVGIGCRFPGGSDGPERFWSMLREGRDAIVPVPEGRWQDGGPDPAAAHLRMGGFLQDVDLFDAGYFGITPREAALMDPQQRIVLEVAVHALEHAALPPSRLRASRCGVFVGAMGNDYTEVVRDAGALDVHTVTGLGNCVIAGRLSYVLGLQGPAMTVDTACSSSLVAVHLACQSLRAGECDAALAGGVNLMLTPTLSRAEDKARMLSKGARCRTFDASADGIVRGEGCGLVVLKRLGTARTDGDRILALVLGSAVNHDGASAGLTVPNQRAQEKVLRDALECARLTPAEVDCVEAHGTGTSLGDPIELAALASTLAASRSPQAPLLVGSVKTNVGHLEAASGMAGLVKLVLSLLHDELPAHLHLRVPSTHFDWGSTAIRVPTAATAWPRGARARIGGVSSFSLSGTNAHVLVGDPPAPGPAPTAPLPKRTRHLLPLSAKTPRALHVLAAAHVAHLEAHPGLDVADLCFTAGAGRDHHAERVAVVAGSVQGLRDALSSFVGGTPSDAVITRSANAAAADAAHDASTDADTLARHYADGGDVDWLGFDRGRARRRLSLPTYPFERQRHWVTPAAPAPAAAARRPESAHADAAVGQALAFVRGLSPAQAQALLAQPPDSLSQLGAERLELLARLLGAPAAAPAKPASGMVRYYDSAAGLEGMHERAIEQDPSAECYLRFAPFDAPVPGFSWLSVALDGSPDTAQWRLSVQGQRELRELLLRTVDMQRCTRLLDIGCGYASDLVQLALRHPRLHCDGYTLSPRQADVAARRIEALGLGERVRVFNRDSARDAFPERYDAMLGFEVVHHIKDKLALFANVRRQLADDGQLMLADFVSNASFALDHAETSSYIVRTETWAELLAYNRLRIAEAVDISAEVGHYLTDPQFEQRLTAAGAGSGYEDARKAAQSYDRLGRLLAKGLVSYVLLTICPESRLSTERTLRRNLEVLGAQRRLADVVSERASHEIVWREEPVVADAAPALPGAPGTWLVVGNPDDALVPPLAQAIEAAGHACVRMSGHLGGQDLDGVLAADPSWRGLLLLDSAVGAPAAESELPQACRGAVTDALELLQVLHRRGIRALERCCIVTRASQAVRAGDPAPDQRGAPLFAFAGSLANEHPALRVARLDLPALASAADVDAVWRCLCEAPPGGQVAVRDGRTWTPHLAALRRPRAAAAATALDPQAAYLITGASGGLGRATARWMAERGARRLFLVSRRPPADAGDPQQWPGEPTWLEADVADEASVRGVLERIAACGAPLKGIFHAAGVLDDGLLLLQSAERMDAVMRPKIDGAWHLHVATQGLALDFFAMYSSLASVLGSPTQAAYAAGNGFMDALAHGRRALGLPATSIAWGPWAEAGMFARLDAHARERSQALGIEPLSTARALRLLDDALAPQAPAVFVACALDAALLARQPAFAASAALLAERGPDATDDRPVDAPASPRAADAPRAPAAADAAAPFLEQLRAMFALVMGMPAEAMDVNASLLNLGLDSLMAVELREAVNQRFSVDLDLGHVLQGASLVELSAKLEAELARPAPSATPVHAAAAPPQPAAPARIDVNTARDLLTSVDALSEADRDLVLRRMLEEERP